MADIVFGEVSWERMIRAVEKVQERLLRATRALEEAGILYAVAGDNAVAAWVARVDESAVRNTPDVDIVLRRADLERANVSLAAVGFVYRGGSDIHRFLDGPSAKARDVVHIIFAGEKLRSEYLLPAPDVTDSESTSSFRLLALEALVRMKVTSFQCKDRVCLRDLIDVGLVDGGWCARLPTALAERLQQLLDNPEGSPLQPARPGPAAAFTPPGRSIRPSNLTCYAMSCGGATSGTSLPNAVARSI
jgi:hypothetical protein